MTAPQPEGRKNEQFGAIMASAWKHPKFQALLDQERTDAIGVWAMLLSWAACNWQENGFISRRNSLPLGMTDEIADVLADARLIDYVNDERGRGYEIHDYNDFNCSSDEIRAEKDRKAERQAAYRNRRNQHHTETASMTPQSDPGVIRELSGGDPFVTDNTVITTPSRKGHKCGVCDLSEKDHSYSIVKGRQPEHPFTVTVDAPIVPCQSTSDPSVTDNAGITLSESDPLVTDNAGITFPESDPTVTDNTGVMSRCSDTDTDADTDTVLAPLRVLSTARDAPTAPDRADAAPRDRPSLDDPPPPGDLETERKRQLARLEILIAEEQRPNPPPPRRQPVKHPRKKR